MRRLPIIVLLAALAASALSACATPSPTKYTVTPKAQVVVKDTRKKGEAQANYQVSPEEAERRSGLGGKE
jgi:hypothetical protein